MLARSKMERDDYYHNFKVVSSFPGTRCLINEVVFSVCDLEKPACAVVKSIPASHHRARKEVQCTSLASNATDVAVRYYSHFEQDGYVNLVIERCHRGNLMTFLRGDRPITDLMKQTMCARLARGLYEIHRVKVAHRDIKPENILINSRDELVYCDFGESKIVQEAEGVSTIVGTPQYLDPRILMNHHKGYREAAYSPFKLDIWCLGHVLLEILAGKILKEWPNGLLAQDALNALLRKLMAGVRVSRPVLDFVFSMLSVNEFERPDAETVHAFFERQTVVQEDLGNARLLMTNLKYRQIEALLQSKGPCHPEVDL